MEIGCTSLDRALLFAVSEAAAIHGFQTERNEMTRQFNCNIMQPIQQRWSPRALSRKPVPREDVIALLEAARYAPSCFNEQPWRFIVADQPDTLEKARSTLTEKNRRWADNAPVLIVILARKYFEKNSDSNRWHTFDAGAAWGFLALEAHQRGLVAHAMGGFSPETAHAVFDISDEYTVITVVAVGYMGDPAQLPADLLEKEHPAARKPLSELILQLPEGRLFP